MNLYETDNCPACGANLRGKPIPKALRHHYGGKTHYRRVIGIYSPTTKERKVARCLNPWPMGAT